VTLLTAMLFLASVHEKKLAAFNGVIDREPTLNIIFNRGRLQTGKLGMGERLIPEAVERRRYASAALYEIPAGKFVNGQNSRPA
jgi:hypothetical protein